jgi:hypothetical protein
MPRYFKLSDYIIAGRDGETKLAPHAFPGMYPLFYIHEDSEVLCPKCANDFQEEIVDADANWEDLGLYCSNCDERIPSAYAEDD